MTAQKGRLFLLKIGAETVQTARSTSMTINNEQVDITAKDTNGWRELLEDGGIKSMTISLSGPFKDAAVEEVLRGYAQANSINAMSVVSGNGDVWSGDFAISSYARNSDYNDVEAYDVTLESSGIITFTPA